MKILYSTEIFTRRGKRRLRGLLEQLVASTPVFEPTTSTLLDGTWERQGQHPRRVKTIELKAGRDSMMYTYDFYVGGLVKITQFWASATLDNARFSLRQEFVRASVGGFEFRLPPTFRTLTTEVLYLDSDLFICKRAGSKSDDIYLKPTEDQGVIQRSMRRSSPLRLRQRSMAVLRNVWDLLGFGRQAKAAAPGPDNMIGGLDWRAEAPAPWQTEENLLEQAAEADIDFNVQDLLEGRVKRRLKRVNPKGDSEPPQS